jgi:hypothetical protein
MEQEKKKELARIAEEFSGDQQLIIENNNLLNELKVQIDD